MFQKTIRRYISVLPFHIKGEKMAQTIIMILVVLTCMNLLALNDQKADNRIGTFQLIKDVKIIKIPFVMVKGKPVIDALLNGYPAKLMIDNGRLWDPIWLFGTTLSDSILTEEDRLAEIGGAGTGDKTEAKMASDITLEFKEIKFLQQEVVISPSSAGYGNMFPGIDGQICNTFFSHFIVEFDFKNNTILLHKPDQFKAPKKATVLTMTLEKTGGYSVPVSITLEDGRTICKQTDIDLGGTEILLIGLNNDNKIEIPENTIISKSYGAQGECEEFKGKIKELKIGKERLENPDVAFSDERVSRLTPNNLGIIGLPLFKKYKTIFDYFNNKLYLVNY